VLFLLTKVYRTFMCFCATHQPHQPWRPRQPSHLDQYATQQLPYKVRQIHRNKRSLSIQPWERSYAIH
jgi:hypothetical protein